MDLQTIFSYINDIFRNIYLKLLSAFIILLIGFIIGKIVSKVVGKFLHDIEFDKVLKKAMRINVSLEKGISSFSAYIIYFITIIIVLNQLNVATTVLQMLLAAVIIVIVVSILFAIKDFIPNMFAGYRIYKHDLINVGEIIRVKGVEGRIIEITLLETKLKTKEGDVVYLPNSIISKSEIIKLNKPRKSAKKK